MYNMCTTLHIPELYSTGVTEPQQTILFPYYIYIHSPSMIKHMAICVSQ